MACKMARMHFGERTDFEIMSPGLHCFDEYWKRLVLEVF